MTYFIRDASGHDYRVGTWVDGNYVPGAWVDAMRELNLLDEPGAYVWGRILRDAQPTEGGAE